MHEVELKLQVPGEARAALEAALDVAHWQRTALEAHYFDTAGGQLAAHGFSWRLRKENGRWKQTLKGDGGHLLQRLEDELEVEAEAGRAVPRPDVTRHRDSPAGRALAAALGGSLDDLSTLVVEQFHTRIERRTRLMNHGDAQVEVAFDAGSVHAKGQTAPVCELELELKAGAPEGLFALARPWVAAHGLWLSTISKSQRGALLAAGHTHGPVVKAGVPALDWSMSPPALLRAIVASCLAQILPNASEIAAGSVDADHVHQARVGLRRLRTALRELGELAPVLDPERQEVLATAFSRLGEVRDQEAVSRTVLSRLAEAGAPEELQWPRPEGEVHQPGPAVRDAAFQAVLLELLEFSLSEPPPQPGCKRDGACRKGLRRRLARLHKQVVHDGERFTELSVEHQHRVRKRLKRLRYLSEFLSSLYGTHAVERYVEALRPAQDALGLHNDDAVGLEAFNRAKDTQPQAWFAVGWLSAQQRETARECRRALRKVADAPRFWKKKGKH
ncbi:CYTH and CHAD domain-containing protein [Azohydromonas caseinilytica]|uniref:CYTH and CHAD domain-containing protein n=1 Tax=Azohydromonas caseinilytica TaxID=2728836 RepID=UPI002872DD3C|nr:CYTH and CHAD domain-containing protein [Azohydromonas caseinilytica]